MTPRRAHTFRNLIARIRGQPRSAEPSHEHIIKVELRSLLERDCYREAIFRLETSPGHMGQLLELLRDHEVELPGVATLSQLAKRGADISQALDALSLRLLCDDLNISSYSSRALTHYYMARANLEEIDLLLSSGVSSVQYGCAEGLREAMLSHNVFAIDYSLKQLFSGSDSVLEHVVWALRSAAELGSKDVRKSLFELSAHHMRRIKESDNAPLGVYRNLAQVNELASPREE